MDITPGVEVFEIESSELLEELEKNLLIMETSPEDSDLINSIFRAVHTIKGSSGLVGFTGVGDFTHIMENVLSKLRDGELKVTVDFVELMLESRDHIANLVKLAIDGIKPDEYILSVERNLTARMAASLGEDVMPRPAGIKEPEIVESVPIVTERSVESKNWHISLRFGPDTFRSGMDPISFIHYLDDLGKVVSLTTVTDSIPSLDVMVHDICYLGFEIDFRTSASRAEIEDVFDFVKDDCKIRLLPPRAVIEEYMALITDLPEETEMVGEMLVKGGALTPFELLQALRLQEFTGDTNKKPLGDILIDEGLVEHEVLDSVLQKQQGIRDNRFALDASKTIRVDTGKLDALINIVGEMVIAQANIKQNASRLRDIRMNSAESVMARLIQELRERVTDVRMIPINNILNKYHRTIRDICAKSGKKINLIINGGDTEIDRNVAEKLSDPLMHLIRNAADHGIATVAECEASGKPTEGNITINASQDAGYILVEIIDDGQGIDHEKVLQKATDMGIVTNAERMKKEEVIDLIFYAGLSTKDKATNISGRGVGMDVVRQNIQEMRGKVEIESEKGKGTIIRVRLPLTLAIIDGFLVRVGQQIFAMPLDIISECIELTSDNHGASRDRHLFKLRDSMLPYVRLKEFFDITKEQETERSEFVVVIKHKNKEIGLAVDELFGETQIVIKSLGKVYEKVECISGATILGDGSVAMILDVSQIIQKSVDSELKATEDYISQERNNENIDS